MSSRLLAVGLTILLTAAACIGDGERSPITPSATTEPPPVATTTTVPRDAVAEETTTTTEAFSFERSDAPVEAVVARDDGLWLVLASGEQAQVWAFPTALGLALGDESVVAQAASTPTDFYPLPKEGPVLVLNQDDLGRIDAPDGFSEIQLHDAGFIEGRAVILVTVASRSDPETAEERLLLWDLETEEWADLGVSGGWESGVGQARLTGSGIAVSLFGEGEGSGWLEHRDLDGSITWQTEPGTGDGTIVYSQETEEILVLGAGFTGDAFLPVLGVRTFAEKDGSETRQARLELVLPEGLSIGGGFCSTAEPIGYEVLCDQTYGGPLLISLESGVVHHYGDFEESVVTLVRQSR